MPTREVALDEYRTGTVAADGTCVITLGPVRNQTWKVANESVECIPPSAVVTPLSPTCKLYLGPSTTGNYLTSTYDGANDSASVAVTLPRGGLLTALWEDADPGAVCKLSVYGTMVVFG